MKKQDYRLAGTDVFVLDLPDCYPSTEHWLYSPLAGVSLLADDTQFEALEKAFDDPTNVPPDIQEEYRQLTNYEKSVSVLKAETEAESFDRLVIIPNTICNFKCSYCYSAAGRMGKEVDSRACYIAVDDFLKRKKGAVFKLGFVGGGEPMLSFDIVEKTLKYAADRASTMGVDFDFHIVTNGSIINDKIIETMKRFHVTLGISFDVLEDVQEEQRGHYSLVSQNIHRFIESGIVPGIKTTITPCCCSRMNEMVEAVHKTYPEIQNLLFQVVNDPAIFADKETLHCFLAKYIQGFFAAKRLGKNWGIHVQDTLQAHCRQLTCRYCPGEYCLTPSGTLSSCDCVSSPKESFYEMFTYGIIANDHVELNSRKLLDLRRCNMLSETRCADCFAKYHCGADCLYRRKLLPAQFHSELCRFNKEFIRRELFDMFSDALYSVTGKEISEFLTSTQSKESPDEN